MRSATEATLLQCLAATVKRLLLYPAASAFEKSEDTKLMGKAKGPLGLTSRTQRPKIRTGESRNL
jgi:hypothetical protein